MGKQNSETALDCPRFHRKDLGQDVKKAYVAYLDDAHVANIACDIDLLKATRDAILSVPHMYVFVGADLLENALRNSKSDSYRVRVSPSDERKYVRDEILKPLAREKRILGVTDSNHNARSRKDDDSDHIGAMIEFINEGIVNEKDKIPYEEGGIWVGLSLGRRGNNGKPYCYGLFCYHGWASGRKTGNALNAAEDILGWIGADVIFVGHAHKPAVSYPVRFDPDWTCDRFFKRKVCVAMTGSYLLWRGYAREKGYRPYAPGAAIVALSGTRKEAEARHSLESILEETIGGVG